MSVMIIRGKVTAPLEIEDFDSDAMAVVIHLDPAGVQPPVVRKARCVVNALNVREAAPDGRVLGQLRRGDVVEVLEEAALGSAVWLRIGWRQWCAQRVGAAVYMEYVT